METWLTYTPADFLLFSPRVYERLFVLHNQDLWPWQIAALASALFVIVLAYRGTRSGSAGREAAIVLAILGTAWLIVAAVFFMGRYQAVNWLGTYIAPLAALQGGILIAMSFSRRARFIAAHANSFAYAAGIALLTIAVLVYPLLAMAFGLDPKGAQFVGLTPDPTAIATLGTLALLEGRARAAAAVLPAAWCIFSALTLWTLDRAGVFVTPTIVALALVAIAMPRNR